LLRWLLPVIAQFRAEANRRRTLTAPVSRAWVKAFILKKYSRAFAARLKPEVFPRFDADEFKPGRRRKNLQALEKAAGRNGTRRQKVKYETRQRFVRDRDCQKGLERLEPFEWL
jgi:hypothetical protein